jgi:hypothetical protein
MEKHLDVIGLELKVVAVQMNLEIWMQGDLEVTLNGEKPYSDHEIVNYQSLLKSFERSGKYYIFSCSCGIPECSNWKEGITVIHEENTVKWIDSNRNRVWHFDKSNIWYDLKNINKEVKIFKRYFTKKQIEYVGFGYEE